MPTYYRNKHTGQVVESDKQRKRLEKSDRWEKISAKEANPSTGQDADQEQG